MTNVICTIWKQSLSIDTWAMSRQTHLKALCHFIQKWKRPCVVPPASWWGRKLPPTNLTFTVATLTYDLDPCDLWPWPWPFRPLTYDLDLWPWPLWTWAWIVFSDTRLKTGIFTFLTLVTLTFDLWPWPSNSSKIWSSLMPGASTQIRNCVPLGPQKVLFCVPKAQKQGKFNKNIIEDWWFGRFTPGRFLGDSSSWPTLLWNRRFHFYSNYQEKVSMVQPTAVNSPSVLRSPKIF